MMTTCNEERFRYMPSLTPEGGPCGLTYDDAKRSTICPHEPLSGVITVTDGNGHTKTWDADAYHEHLKRHPNG